MLVLCFDQAIMFTQVMPPCPAERNLDHEIVLQVEVRASVCGLNGPLIKSPPQKPKVPLQDTEMYRGESAQWRELTIAQHPTVAAAHVPPCCCKHPHLLTYAGAEIPPGWHTDTISVEFAQTQLTPQIFAQRCYKLP